MAVDIRYANKKITERFITVLKTYFNDSLSDLTLDPIQTLPCVDTWFEQGFNINEVKRLFSLTNTSQTAVYVTQDGPSEYTTDYSCSTTTWTRERMVPIKLILIQKIEIAEQGYSYQLNDNDSGRILTLEEIGKKRGDHYLGAMDYIINRYLKDAGVSVLDVKTTSDFNAGAEEALPDFGLLLYCEISFDVSQEVSYTIEEV